MMKESKYSIDIITNNGTHFIKQPSELSVNGETYCFITNTQKKSRINLLKAAELIGYTVIFVDNASDMYAHPIPEYCGVYMLKSDYDTPYSLERLFKTNTEIALRYKDALIKRGYDVELIPLTDIYLGCETKESIPRKK